MDLTKLIIAARLVDRAAQDHPLKEAPALTEALEKLRAALWPKPSVLAGITLTKAPPASLGRPKRDYVRSQTLRDAYRLIPCQNCGKDDGTQCCAHSNWSVHGKGGHIKADDSRGATLCNGCHIHILDQGSKLSKAARKEMWWAAHVASVKELRKRRLWPKHVVTPDTSHCPF